MSLVKADILDSQTPTFLMTQSRTQLQQEHQTLDPAHVSLLGGHRIVPHPQFSAHRLNQGRFMSIDIAPQSFQFILRGRSVQSDVALPSSESRERRNHVQ